MKKILGLLLGLFVLVSCDKNDEIKPVNIIDDKVIEITIGDEPVKLDAGIVADDLKWRSEGYEVSVDQNGVIKPLKSTKGVKIIVVSESKKYTKTFTVRVLDILTTGITLDCNDILCTEPGDEFMLKAIVTPENSTQSVIWKSSDEDVLIIDEKGNVTVACDLTETAEAKIIARSGDFEVEVKVKVYVFNEPADDAEITISLEQQQYVVVEEYNLEAAKIKLNISPLCTLDEQEYRINFVTDRGWTQETLYNQYATVIKDKVTHEYFIQIDSSVEELDFSDMEISYYITLVKVKRQGHDDYIIGESDQSLKINIVSE